jgi:methylenetetrahydrofolate--tRNA-(uracil-5-)-methyltransferase
VDFEAKFDAKKSTAFRAQVLPKEHNIPAAAPAPEFIPLFQVVVQEPDPMDKKSRSFHIVGGGLAGCEAAWQLLNQGHKVTIHEMRPVRMTAAHKTGNLAELVCSNSLKSLGLDSAPGRLKEEMKAFDSLIIAAGLHASVPAGQALAVDREVFSKYINDKLSEHPGFTRIDEEVTAIPDNETLEASNEVWIVSTGPLTAPDLSAHIAARVGRKDDLYFYDAIAPVIAADSIDYSKAFRASRYGNDAATGDAEAPAGDYLNIPLNKDEYEAFITAIETAEYMPLHDFEEPRYFESCLPVEVMAGRGRETLRFGPMKPVGLTDPATGRRPWAAIQLRQENKEGTMFSMVGFQTKMKWPEQKRVFSMLPALAQAEFLRFGSVHRNTYFNSPQILSENLALKSSPRIFLAGQITGVEGYTESAAIGLLAGRFAGGSFVRPPSTTVIGSLHSYVVDGCLGDFQPMNANLGLLPPTERRRGESKADKKARQCAAAKDAFQAYFSALQPSSGLHS